MHQKDIAKRHGVAEVTVSDPAHLSAQQYFDGFNKLIETDLLMQSFFSGIDEDEDFIGT